jgi:serine/threonine-protein kinase
VNVSCFSGFVRVLPKVHMVSSALLVRANASPSASPDVVRDQVERIIRSGVLGNAESLTRLLRYVTEETLSDRGERLKEYTIGVEVFHRGADFDPRIDTIVRTQARRLRAKLEEYYAAAGAADPVFLQVPKGTYVPEFRLRSFDAPRRRGWRGAVAGGAFLLAVALLSTPRHHPVSATAATRHSVAVLPFAMLDAPSGDASIADGVSEEISLALGAVPGLRVASRTSTMVYKGRGVDARRLGSTLGVSAIVEGTVRRSGKVLRINAHLVSTANGYRLWSGSWEMQPEMLHQLPKDAAGGIARAFHIAPAAPETSTSDTAAHREYLLGRFRPISAESIVHLDRALQIDPRYGAAWLAKAEAHLSLAKRGALSPAEMFPKARDAAYKAIEHGQDVAAAHTVIANVAAYYDWDWPRAEKEFRIALDMEPHNPWWRFAYAILLAFGGHTDRSLEQMAGIQTLDAAAWTLVANQAVVYYLARQYDRVITHCRSVFDAMPANPDCHYWTGRAYLSKGMIAEAIASLEKRRPIPGIGFGMPVTAYLAAGRRADAIRLRREAFQRASTEYVSPVSLAQVHFAFGENDAGFRQLERALALKDPSAANLKVEPAYDAVRSDPRFQAILRKLRL